MAPLQPKGSHFGLILPLCTSSATLGLALFQYPIFSAFLNARNHSIAGSPLSSWWEAFVPGSVGVIAPACVTSSVAGVFAARWLHTHSTLETTSVGRWYAYGAAFAAAHLLFAPLVARSIKSVVDGGKEVNEGIVRGSGSGLLKGTGGVETAEARLVEHNRAEMKNWLMWHTIRTLTTDVPALWCFAEGAALSFWVI